MVAIAIANGAVREAGLKPRLGDARARQLSTVLLVLFFAVYMAAVFRLHPVASTPEAVEVGLLWLVLTLAFELGLGRWVSRLSWSQILAEYDVFAGRLWILVPLWVAIAPYVYFRWQARG